MMNQELLTTMIKSKQLKDNLAAVDVEFKDYLNKLSYRKNFAEGQLQTFSPLDAVADFKQHGLQQVREVSASEMLNDTDALKKLLANMLSQCRPGHLTADDMEQLSGINGREVSVGL